MKLSIVIPVYNEKKTLSELVSRVEAVNLEKEIIIIDDASTDGTRDLLKKYEGQERFKVIYQSKNAGKGSALRAGFEKAEGEIIIVQDGDLEYDPKEYPQLIKPILDGRADVVYGSRFLGGTHRVFFFWHYVGNKVLTTISNMCTNLCLTDMETGYKIFRREVLDAFTLKCNRFGFEPEFTSKVARHSFRVYEVPISYSGRGYEEGKKIDWKDGVAALWFIFRFRFFSS
ncbi:MAG: glycosyltransferase family 2 protein [Nitrospina sp.]|nr:glycosyltransferase family 2 protein [Nitrospina sp.]